MTNKEIAALAFRILGLYLLITQMTGLLLNSALFFVEDEAFSTFKIIQAGTYGLSLLIAALIWLFADSLANRTTSEIASTEAPRVIMAEDLKSTAFAVIGISLIVSSLPALINVATQYAVSDSETMRFSDSQFLLGLLSSNVLRLIIGLWLFLGNRGIIGTVNRIRNTGGKEPDADHTSA